MGRGAPNKPGLTYFPKMLDFYEDDKIFDLLAKFGPLTIVKPYKTKVQVLNECGFPVISKRIAGKIALLQNPSEKNKTVRHAIITGECGELGHFAKNSRMKLPQKWLKYGNLIYEHDIVREQHSEHIGEVKF